MGLKLNEALPELALRSRGIRENPLRLDGPACASSFEIEDSALVVPTLLDLFSRVPGDCP
jgi:hypothetical protein